MKQCVKIWSGMLDQRLKWPGHVERIPGSLPYYMTFRERGVVGGIIGSEGGGTRRNGTKKR